MHTKQQIASLLNRLLNIKFMLLVVFSGDDDQQENFNKWLTSTYADKKNEVTIRFFQRFSDGLKFAMAVEQAKYLSTPVEQNFYKALFGDDKKLAPEYARQDTPGELFAKEYKDGFREGFVACQSKAEWRLNGRVEKAVKRTEVAIQPLRIFLEEHTGITQFFLDRLGTIEAIGKKYQAHIFEEMDVFKTEEARKKIVRKHKLGAADGPGSDTETDIETEEEGEVADIKKKSGSQRGVCSKRPRSFGSERAPSFGISAQRVSELLSEPFTFEAPKPG
jgi:hypothetical protein